MDVHWAMLDVVEDFGPEGAVDGDLVEIGSKAMAMGIGIGKEPGLQDSISRRTHSRHKVTRRKCGLLSLCEMIDGVSVEDDLSDFDEGIVLLRDHLGGIKKVVFIIGDFPLRNGLDAELPLSSLSGVDVVDHVPLGVIWILETLSGLLEGHILDSRESTNMDLNPKDLALLILPAEAMSAVLMHMPVVFGSAPVAEVHHIQMAGFIVVGDEVPKVIGVFEISARVLLSGVCQVRKFHWILNPKYGQRIAHEIPIALLGVKLEAKTSRVPLGIS